MRRIQESIILVLRPPKLNNGGRVAKSLILNVKQSIQKPILTKFIVILHFWKEIIHLNYKSSFMTGRLNQHSKYILLQVGLADAQ